MSIFYIEEHTSCGNYISDYKVGFKYYKVAEGEDIALSDNDLHCLFFLVEGSVDLIYESRHYEVQKDTLCFIPISSKYSMKATSDALILLNYFNRPIDLCEKLALESLSQFYESGVHNPVLEIRKPLRNFLDSMMFYLDNGIYCKHFHEIKQKELFFLLRYFYSKDEVASLFAPIISSNVDFKNMVLGNYLHANSVKELAGICHYSLSSFNRRFKESFSENPYIWLQNQRVKYIAGKLSDKHTPFGQIIDEFRFSSPSHFTIFCKKHLNATPSQYRKEHLK
ncbi:MAG: helix-turn-helix transcriptional regulator [Dysgonamonadaceae bacterium]|jgi:AraC-like DNA-binding protein|nr:helix-turn-helix transcriptional regulator [Dysgonamonadaceae bacterium]